MREPYYDIASREWVIPLGNKAEIRSGWTDLDDPDALPAGDYLKVLDPTGKEVFYADSADIFADPVTGREQLWAMIQACSTILSQGEV